MLDFEDYTPEREIDVELRYTHIRLEELRRVGRAVWKTSSTR
jgi:hypothetical protein